jgi:hypothetical protein
MMMTPRLNLKKINGKNKNYNEIALILFETEFQED